MLFKNQRKYWLYTITTTAYHAYASCRCYRCCESVSYSIIFYSINQTIPITIMLCLVYFIISCYWYFSIFIITFLKQRKASSLYSYINTFIHAIIAQNFCKLVHKFKTFFTVVRNFQLIKQISKPHNS